MYRHLAFCLITFLLFSNAAAQIPDNFNFLNHSIRNFENSAVTQIKLVNNKLIAVHNSGLDLVSYDYRISREEQPLAEGYKFICENDSTYHYTSWVHTYGDAIAQSLITSTTVNDESVQHTYDFIFNNDVSGFDITHDTTGGYWCISGFGRDLLYLKDGEVRDAVAINQFLNKLYTSCSGDIYLIKSGELQYFDGQELVYIFDLPRFDHAYQYNGYNYLLDSDRLYKYDCEMNTQLKEWTLPITVGSFNQIDIGIDDMIHIHQINSPSYFLYSIDSTSQITSEYFGTVDDDEVIGGVAATTDSTHMVFGEHQFVLSSQTFYRNYNINEQLDYPTVDLQISDFNIEYFDAGIRFDYITGDSVDIQQSNSELTINNLTSDSIYALDVFSNLYRDYITAFRPEEFIRSGIDSVLAPLESRNADRFFINPTTLEELENIRVELTGANYKFLENGSQVLMPNLLISSIESTELEPFKIYPNPVTDHIIFSLDKDDRVSILSAEGKLYSSYNVASKIDRIDVSALMPGLYYIVLQNKNKSPRIGKFIKL